MPLAQEAKKLAEELHKEEIASQWTGLPPKKLLQESFVQQLDALQALDQLALLTAAKEHLPGDISSTHHCHIEHRFTFSCCKCALFIPS